jgi:hypothetical protein
LRGDTCHKKAAVYPRFGSVIGVKAAEKKIKSSKTAIRYPINFPLVPFICKKGTSTKFT